MIPIFIAVVILAVSHMLSGGTDSSSAISSVDSLVAAEGLSDPPDGKNSLIPDDSFADMQWALISIGISDLWQITMGSEDVLVAILDTGIDRNHEDLQGRVVAEINFTQSPDADDVNGHGTHVAGIVAAQNNGIGIIGLAPDCRLLNVKVADDRGRCKISNLIDGIIWAVDSGAKVINISIEIKESSPELEEAIEYAWKRGAVVVAAAGNNGSQTPVYPAFYDNSIAVAAIKEDKSLAPLSNQGDWIDLAAPGFQIYSTLPGNSYGFETGTSFAAAHVSGIAALLFTVVTDKNGNGFLNDEIRAIIEAGCNEIDIGNVGQGCIDVTKLVIQ